jgi:hypothetical protein
MSDFQTLGLLFYDPKEPGALAGPAAGAIYLQTFSTGVFPGWDKETHRLTPVEYTPEIFDAHADRLIENIQELKKEARREFEKARKRELAALGK